MRKIAILVMLSIHACAWAQFMGGGFGGGFNPGAGGFGGFEGFGGFGGFGGETVFNPSQSRNHIDFESSNLPVIIINTDESKPIVSSGKSGASMRIIDNKGRRNRVSDKPAGYDGRIGIKLRGNSSMSFEQKSFTIETRNADGTNNNVSLLGMPADNDWALIAPYNDISMIRNVLAYDMWQDMGHWGPRTRMVELVINNEYQGVYIFTETIKRSKDRISIAKLKADDNSGTDITGGYILRIDAYDADDLTFTSKVSGLSSFGGGFGGGFGGFGGGFGGFGGGNQAPANPVIWTIRTPKREDITDAQKEYIESYIHEMEAAIAGPDFADPENGYSKYISVSSFVDYLIHTEVSMNADGLKRSAYFYKKKQNADGSGGKLHAGSVWDYNLAYGNCNFCNANKTDAWVYEGGETSPTPFFWKRLLEDPAFLDKVKERYTELRGGILSQDSIEAFIDSYAAKLSEAQSRQYSKYSDLLVQSSSKKQPANGFGGFGGFGGSMGGFGGGDMISMFAAYRVASYQEETDTLKAWFKERLAFLDSNWLVR